MRLFVAVLFSEDEKNILYGSTEKMRRDIQGVKWVDKENLHVTLSFLGEEEPGKISGMLKGLRCETVDFSVELRPTVFHRRGVVNVIKYDMRDCSTLEDLARSVRGRLSRGDDREKLFSPHVTLGRPRGRIMKSELEGLEQGETDVMDVHIDSFVLMKSTLTPGGALYEVMERYPLGKG